MQKWEYGKRKFEKENGTLYNKTKKELVRGKNFIVGKSFIYLVWKIALNVEKLI